MVSKSQIVTYLLSLSEGPYGWADGEGSCAIYDHFIGFLLAADGFKQGELYAAYSNFLRDKYPKWPTDFDWFWWYKDNFYLTDEEFIEELKMVFKLFAESIYFQGEKIS